MLCDRKECTGCFACYNSCPKKAITMKEDKCGFIYPVIDKEKCVNCKICEKVCPSLKQQEFLYPEKCYAGKVKDEVLLKSCTSGGIATAISEKVLEENGVVYGASFQQGCIVSHIRVTNKEDLKLLKGSKYVHSYINYTYKLAKKDLDEGKRVLFIGTPCQIAGIKSFLNKEYEKLFLVDIICHGVPSQSFLKDEVQECIQTLDIDRINFRNKIFEEFTFEIEKNNQSVYQKKWNESNYYNLFMQGLIYRENCYYCKYARPERVSDLTIGDFWGLKEDSIFYHKRNKGISVILVNNSKGEEILKKISENIILEPREVNEAIEGNEQLKHPVEIKPEIIKFYDKYNKGEFKKTYRKSMKNIYYKETLKKNVIIKKINKLRRMLKNGKQ